MKKSKKTIEVKVERTIAATPGEVFDGWLDLTPGIWNGKLIALKPESGRVLLLAHQGDSPLRAFHPGPAAGADPAYPGVSRYTSGEESMVTVTFKKRGKDTLMRLVHSGLPNNELSKAHKDGWNYFLDKLAETFAGGSPESVKEPKGWRD